MQVTNVTLELIPVGYRGSHTVETETLQEMMSSRGMFYLLVLKQNGVQQIRDAMRHRHRLKSDVYTQFGCGKILK
jgi:hypothetical protein